MLDKVKESYEQEVKAITPVYLALSAKEQFPFSFKGT